jgi:hypothetical protein
MQCAQRTASRAAAWRRRRVAVVRPVRIDAVRNFVFSRVSKEIRKPAKCRNTVPSVGRSTKLASVVFGQRRSDARYEPAFSALSLASKWRIHAAPRTSTRADAREHGAVSDETNIKVHSRNPTVPLCCFLSGDAAIAAFQARGHLHVAVAYGARSGRTKKREANTGAPVRMP